MRSRDKQKLRHVVLHDKPGKCNDEQNHDHDDPDVEKNDQSIYYKRRKRGGGGGHFEAWPLQRGKFMLIPILMMHGPPEDVLPRPYVSQIAVATSSLTKPAFTDDMSHDLMTKTKMYTQINVISTIVVSIPCSGLQAYDKLFYFHFGKLTCSTLR